MTKFFTVVGALAALGSGILWFVSAKAAEISGNLGNPKSLEGLMQDMMAWQSYASLFGIASAFCLLIAALRG